MSQNNKAVIIDAGADPEDIKNILQKQTVAGILITHAHFDHIFNLEKLAQIFNVPVYIQKSGVEKLYNAKLNFSERFIKAFKINKKLNIIEVSDNDIIKISDNFLIKVLETPGHSSCSVCYKINNLLFAGDTLFENGIGRCDLEPDSKSKMVSSLEKLSVVTGYDIVYSGHGKESSYERQQRNISINLKYLKRSINSEI